MDTKKRILIIDDEADIRILLRQLLEQASYDVEVASNGLQGLSVATSSRFDMILLDVKMPGIDGLQVLKQLREYESTKNTPVIVLTGGSLDVDEIVAALDFNPSDFITKVVSSKELIARIKWVFRKQHVS